MRRIPVASSVIQSIGYNPKSSILEVEFKESGVYRYFKVPAALYRAFVKSRSKGRFFDYTIRDIFPFTKAA